MTVEEYKNRTIELTFPSGLCLTVRPPKAKAMLDASNASVSPVEVMAGLMKLMEAGFPADFTLDDISEPKDWAYLQEWVARFFAEMFPTQSAKVSKNSSETAIKPVDNGPTTS
jgi:hypothetical protein